MFAQITQAVTTALYDAFTKNRPQSVSPCRRKRRMIGPVIAEASHASGKSEASGKSIHITYNVPGRILFFLLLFLPFLPAGAQQMTGKDTCYPVAPVASDLQSDAPKYQDFQSAFSVTDGVLVRQGSDSKNYRDINPLGLTLVCKFNQ